MTSTHALAPILLFVYNRPAHTRQTMEALLNNTLASQSDLIVFSDGGKDSKDRCNVEQVRRIIRSVDKFASVKIVENDTNVGLANNVINGVSQVVEEYGKVIVMEDDLVTSPYFLAFMNDGLRAYADQPRVGHIQGYCYPVEEFPETFLTRWIGSWGWATWRDEWQLFNPDGQALMDELKRRRLTSHFDINKKYPYTRMLQRQIDGKNNSWAIRWYASLFLHDKLSLNAGRSLVKNIGFDNSGTHCNDENIYHTTLYKQPINIQSIASEEDKTALRLIEKFHGKTWSTWAKINRRINRYLRTR